MTPASQPDDLGDLAIGGPADLSSADLAADLTVTSDLAVTPDLRGDIGSQGDLARPMVWTMETSNAVGAADLVQIWGNGDVWIAGRSIGGEDPALLRSSGDGMWSRIAVPAPSDLVFGRAGEVWLPPSWRSLDRGATWLADRAFPNGQPCAATHYFYAADLQGFWRSSDGITWSHLLKDVDFPSTKMACRDSLAWAIGNSATASPAARVTRFDDSGFVGTSDFAQLHFDGIAAFGHSLFVVGRDSANQGILVRSLDDGQTWSAPQTLSPLPLTAVWAASESDVYVAGYHAALHGDGASFSSLGLDGNWFAVWGASANDVYFAGEFARIAHGRR